MRYEGRQAFPKDLFNPQVMRRIVKREDETDPDNINISAFNFRGDRPDFILIELADDLAALVHTFVNLEISIRLTSGAGSGALVSSMFS
jgi:hypothetical protein